MIDPGHVITRLQNKMRILKLLYTLERLGYPHDKKEKEKL